MGTHNKKLEVFQPRFRNHKEQPNTDGDCNNWKGRLIEGINSRLNDTEAQISEMEDNVVEIIDNEQKKKKKDEKKWGQFKRPLGQHQAH